MWLPGAGVRRRARRWRWSHTRIHNPIYKNVGQRYRGTNNKYPFIVFWTGTNDTTVSLSHLPTCKLLVHPLFCFVFKLFPTGSMHSTGTTIFSRRGNLGEVKIRGQSSVIYDESGWLKRHGLSNEPMRPGRGMWWCVKQRQIGDLHLHSTTPCPLQEATFLWLAVELEDASACTSQSARHRFRMDMRGISFMDHQF